MWTGFNWFRIDSSGRLLQTWKQICGLIKRLKSFVNGWSPVSFWRQLRGKLRKFCKNHLFRTTTSSHFPLPHNRHLLKWYYFLEQAISPATSSYFVEDILLDTTAAILLPSRLGQQCYRQRCLILIIRLDVLTQLPAPFGLSALPTH